MKIEDKVKNNIVKNNLILKGERVLVALSGGSDSVTLLTILNNLSLKIGFSLCVCHINHSIRENADSDEEFCRELCKKLGIEFYSKKIDVVSLAREQGISEELCGRNERYLFFSELKDKYNIDKIATAHNKNDSCESILLHLIRGSGVGGLGGIPIIRDNYIIRPLINIKKSEIEEYCSKNSIEYVVDNTNFKPLYTRNKVRLNLIPLIEKDFNPAIVDTITDNAKLFSQTEDFVKSYSKDVYNKISKNGIVDTNLLQKEYEIIIRNVIELAFLDYNKGSEKLSNKFVDVIIEKIKQSNGTKTVNLPNGISCVFEQGKLYFKSSNVEDTDYCYNITIGKEQYIKECDKTILVLAEEEPKKDTKNKIYFYVGLDSKIQVRNKKNGDKFLPQNSDITKKISDYFCEQKITSAERQVFPLLCADNEIVWVTGKRKDRRFSKGARLLSCKIINEGEITNEE